MNTREARELGEQVAMLVRDQQPDNAYALLAPVLAQRTPFSMLRRIGDTIGAGPLEAVGDFLEHIAAAKTMGGWVVVASVLEQQLDRDLEGAFSRSREAIIAGDVWYAADTLGEGVPGRALVAHFHPALELLWQWREDPNRWVRRAVGTSVHFWAKRSRGEEQLVPQARALLDLLEPMFGEWEMDAVKGVGWGLKTLGKHYPSLVAEWLARDVIPCELRRRTLMLRKALTYLSDEQRAFATRGPVR